MKLKSHNIINSIFSTGEGKSNYLHYLILLLILLLGMWQLVLFQNIMKWDILDINLPWGYFVSECLKNGILPLWNPYINLGFPQAADPMTWYPISWAFFLFFKNSLIAVQYQYLFHILIAGFGAYSLAKQLNFTKPASLFVAISYMLSGLFISNAQHLGWIISASWIPFVVCYYLKFITEPKLTDGILLIICLYFLLSGGYPGFFIITCYVLLILFLIESYKLFKANDLVHFKKLFISNLIMASAFLLLSSVVLISSFELKGLLSRNDMLTIDFVCQGSLPMKGLITFLFPFAGADNNAAFWGTDFSLINCYIGIFGLVFFLYGIITSNKSNRAVILTITGLFVMMIALGNDFPFRRWLYHVPFMDVFRFPAIFRLLGYSFFILVAGIGFMNFFKKEGHSARRLILAVSVVLLVYGLFFIYEGFFIEKWKFKKLILFGLVEFTKLSGIRERIFLQAFIDIILLSIFLLGILKFRRQTVLYLVILLAGMDMVIATQLNINQTVVDPASPKATKMALDKLPQGFPIPDLKIKMVECSDNTAPKIPFLWRNLNIFSKTVSCDGYSPYGLATTVKSGKEGLLDKTINYPLFFLVDSLKRNNIINFNTIDSISGKSIIIKSFNPNKVELEATVMSNQYLVFVQNLYPGWCVSVNNSPSELLQTNYAFMSVLLKPGINKVVFEFKPEKTIMGFYISSITFIVLIFILMLKYFKRVITD